MSIQLKEISFCYDKTNILNNCSLEIKKGNIYALLGTNGAGKTTLLKIIRGMLKPFEGQVLIDKEFIQSLNTQKIAKKIAVVGQENSQVYCFSALEMVVMGRNPHISFWSKPTLKDYDKAVEAMEMLGIEHLKKRSFPKLSGGEKQLVLIARALAQDTCYLILDEPTSNLDFTNQHLIMDTIRRIAKSKNLGVVISMHDPNLVYQYCSDVIMLKDGEIIKQGATKTVFSETTISTLYNTKAQIHRISSDKVYVSLKGISGGDNIDSIRTTSCC